MTGRLMPGERVGWCSDCGTAPCAHAPADPAGVDLLAVVVLVTLAVLIGLFLGYLLAAWAVTPQGVTP